MTTNLVSSEETLHAVTKRIKVELKPTKEQKKHIDNHVGASRALYNILLYRAKQQYDSYLAGTASKPEISGYSFVKAITALKQESELQWLNDISITALQQSALNLGTAFSNFFKGLKKNKFTGFPKFKKKKSGGSFHLVGTAFRIKSNSLFLEKNNTPIKVLWQTKEYDLPSVPSSVTIIKRPDGRYFASFVCKVPVRKTNGTKILGLDLGIKDLIVTSDGNKYENPKHLNSIQKQLKRRNQSLARKTKGSRRWKLARVKLAKAYQKMTDCRNDYYHKLTRALVNESQVIGIESLTVSNMIRNRKLSRHIADASWSTLTTMLAYKAIESGHCALVKAERFYASTQTCSNCNHRLAKDDKLTLAQRFWTCPHCRAVHDRDKNAAVNLKKIGVTLLQEKQLFLGTVHTT